MEATTLKKARQRSPDYPAIGLKEAVDKITAVYNKDYQTSIPKHLVAEHAGYNGLNGKSLVVLAALSKYGLLEGRGNECRVSDLAVSIIAHESGSPERIEAIRRAAAEPELFNELNSKYSKASDGAIRAYLLTQKFILPAAEAVIRSYRETKAFVDSETAGYNPPEEPLEATLQQQNESNLVSQTPPNTLNKLSNQPLNAPKPGMRQVVFALKEGDVTITFPEGLSPESVSDLSDYIDVFMRKAKREVALDLV